MTYDTLRTSPPQGKNAPSADPKPGRRLSPPAQRWLSRAELVTPGSGPQLELLRQFHKLPPVVQRELLDYIPEAVGANGSLASEYRSAVEESERERREREYNKRQYTIDSSGAVMTNEQRKRRQQMRELQVLRADPLTALVFGITGSVELAEMLAGAANMMATHRTFGPRGRSPEVIREDASIAKIENRPSARDLKPPPFKPPLPRELFEPIPATNTRDGMGIVIERVKRARGPEDRAAVFEGQIPLLKAIQPDWNAHPLKTTDGSRLWMGAKGFAIVITPEGRIFTGVINTANGMVTLHGSPSIYLSDVTPNLTHPHWRER